MVKEEVWNEEVNEKKDRNREALDKIAREHQKRAEKEWGNPEVKNKRVALCERDSEGSFEPMKVEISPKSEANESGEEESKENVNTANTAGGSSEEESSQEKLGSRTSLVDRTVGHWDSVSQTTKGTPASGAKKVVQSMGKQAMKKKRKRRMQPEIARRTAEKEKEQVKRNLESAEHLWKRLEFPVRGDPTNILAEYNADVIRYDRQGKRFVQLAKAQGTIKAKSRMRDEWKAACYAKGEDRRKLVENAGFEDALQIYNEKTEAWNTSYFRNWPSGSGRGLVFRTQR